jgi:uroporphyrinogen III methyltransferase/synthase
LDRKTPPISLPPTLPAPAIALVGAGPGAADLLTLRGWNWLQSADVVLYDGLVNPEILRLVSPTAACINVGKHGYSRIWKQAEIHQEMLRHYQAGKRVVRLKGGDPAVFARTAEELEFLAQHQIAAEIVPGITAALALPAYTGMPLTHRDHASAVALVTGQQAENSDELDWHALARFPGTLVLYMGVTTAANWSRQLLKAGKPANTPAALVRRVSWPDQQIIHTHLANVADELTPSHKLRPPVLVVVGEVAHQNHIASIVMPHLTTSSTTQLPLHGSTVIITRAESNNDRLSELLTQQGATVVHQPLIQIAPLPLTDPLRESLHIIEPFSWIVFTSVHGVDCYFQLLEKLGLDARKFAKTKFACVGPATAEALKRWNILCDFLPPEHHAQSLAETLPVQAACHVLWVRGTRSKDALRELLPGRCAALTELIVYESTDVLALSPQVEDLLEHSSGVWITLTSSAIARSASKLLGTHFPKLRSAALSPQIAIEATAAGADVIATAEQPSFESLVAAICSASH